MNNKPSKNWGDLVSNQPYLWQAPVTNDWYFVTKYKIGLDGDKIPVEKINITDQVATLFPYGQREAREVVKTIKECQDRYPVESGGHFALAYAIGVVVGAFDLEEYSVFCNENDAAQDVNEKKATEC